MAVLFITAFGASASAADTEAQIQTPPALTLESAIHGALRSDNIALQMQNENVNGAKARVKEAAGAFDWSVNAQAGYQLLFVGKEVNGVVTNQVTTIGSYYYSAGAGKEFRNGISIAPGFIGYPGAGASPAQTGGLTQTRPLLGLKVPLLRGLGEESADATERAAKNSLVGAKLGRTFAVTGLVNNLVQIYWRCLADDKILQLTQAADQTATNYQMILEKMAQKGLIEPRAAKQNAISLVSRHATTETVVETTQRCHRDLAYATTGSISGPVPLISGDLPQVAIMLDAVNHLNTNALIQLALENRPDLQAAQKTAEAANDTLTGAKDLTRPDLSLHIDPESATISYTQSLGNNLAEGQEEAAEAASNQALLNLRQVEDQIRVDVTDAVHSLQQIGSSWSALNTAEQQQETIVSDGKKIAKFGAIGWQDYIGSQAQLLDIQQQVITMQMQFAIALSGLRLTTGSIDMDSDPPARIASKLVSLPMR
jgi:outer membrane protein TolC